MMASRSGRTAKPAPEQPVANPGAGASMGGQDAYQQGNLYQQQGRAYTSAERGGSAYGAAQASSARSACSANGDPEPERGKGKIIGLVVGIEFPRHRGVWRHHGLFFCTRTQRIFRRRRARSCLRSRP